MGNLHKVVRNRRTNEQIVLAKPIDDEIILFDNSILLVELDIHGIVTYANRRFRKLSGYSKDELIGLPNIAHRHPDMPEALFKAMWKIVSEKKIWRGYVKSMTREGKYYWTLMYTQAKFDDNGKIIGYIVTRKKPFLEGLEEAKKHYATLTGDSVKDYEFFMRGELYHGEQLATRD